MSDLDRSGNPSLFDRVDRLETAVLDDESESVVQDENGNVTITGALDVTGVVVTGASVLPKTTVASISGAGVTLTAAQVLGGLIVHSGGTTPTDTLPTAALLVAAISGCRVGTSVAFAVRNDNSGTLTVAAGTGVTLAATNTNTVAAAATRRFLAVVTNVTASSEAVTVYSMGASAH